MDWHGHGPLPLKAFKLISLCILASITAWQCCITLQDFLKHEVVTSIMQSSVEAIEFPQVTFCNYNRFKFSLLTPELVSMADAAYNSGHWNQDAASNLANSTPFDIYNFTFANGWHLVDNQNQDHFPGKRNQTLDLCSFAGLPCNSRFFRHRMTSYGNCYTFNQNLTQNDLNSAGAYTSGLELPLTQTYPSETNGLDVLINIEESDYSETPGTKGNPFIGLKVIIHSKDDQPDPAVSGFAVSPGMYAFSAVKLTQHYNIPPPEGQCDPNAKLFNYPTYTSSACEEECKILIVEKNCSCTPYFYRSDGNRVCNADETFGCSATVIADINRNFKKYCYCPQPCFLEEYSYTLSYVLFPSRYMYSRMIPNSSPSLEYIRNNMVGVRIYFSEIGTTVVTQSPANTITSLLNDLGGTSGLYIGFSCMTFVELVEFVVTCYLEVVQRRRKIADTGKTTIKVAPLH